MTGRGTNTYVLGEGPCLVVDPGPAIDSHLDAIRAEGERRGGIAGVLVTHSHADHQEAVRPLGEQVLWGPAQTTGLATERLEISESPPAEPFELGTPIGRLSVVPTPGHASDHACFGFGAVVLCGDLVLGEGSSIVPPRFAGGSLAAYMRSLDYLEAIDAELLLPGHGPAITDPAARIAEYREHRLMRERLLLAALDAGERARTELLDAAWADVPEPMRGGADVAMQAHLEKLEDEGRLPEGVEPLGWTPSAGELQA
ncbi:MAG: MBL fold metallo-hydrolase [Solirubrobacterales bacterium]|nr:MBL fold metallo-hydrolase [Solirubrobacterales bacterium]